MAEMRTPVLLLLVISALFCCCYSRLPSNCIRSDNGVSCSGLGLSNLSAFTVPAYTEFLSLSNNRITSLGSRLASLTSLRRLWLNNNSLTTLPSDALREAVNLRFLNLSHNRLNALEARALLACRQLETLDLRHNSLTDLDSEALKGLSELRHVDLSHNQLSSLRRSLLGDAKQLRLLRLNHNPLKHIDAEALPFGASLQLLDMTHTSLNHVPGEALSRLTYIDQLVFRNHQLFLTDDMLKGVSVRSINFDACNLRVLPVSAFRCLSGPGLRALSLGRNRLICDCRMLAFRQFARAQRIRLRDAHCAPSGSLASFTIMNFPSNGCPAPLATAAPKCKYQPKQVRALQANSGGHNAVEPLPVISQTAAVASSSNGVNSSLLAVIVILVIVILVSLVVFVVRNQQAKQLLRNSAQRAQDESRRCARAVRTQTLLLWRRVRQTSVANHHNSNNHAPGHASKAELNGSGVTQSGETKTFISIMKEPAANHDDTVPIDGLNSSAATQPLVATTTTPASQAEPRAPPRKHRQSTTTRTSHS